MAFNIRSYGAGGWQPLHKEIGVLTQEVKKVLPEAVYTDDIGMFSVSYNSLVPLLINSIKEQQREIELLKVRLDKAASVKNDNLELASRIAQLEAIVIKQNKINVKEHIGRK